MSGSGTSLFTESVDTAQALKAEHAPIDWISWDGRLIDRLDELLSPLVVGNCFQPDRVSSVILHWLEENPDAGRLLWAIHSTDYRKIFGRLVADLEEDGQTAEATMFFDLLLKARG